MRRPPFPQRMGVTIMHFNGLTDKQVEESRKKYGSNVIPDSEPTTFWAEFKETFKDPMIRILLAIAALSMAGCTKGEYTAPGGAADGGGFRLSVVTKSMSREEVVTRASDPKTEAEREIKELHVFLFGPDGKYLQARQDGGGHSYQGYQSVKGTSTLRIDNEGFADDAYASRATVYVVANVEPGTFGNLTEEGYPEKIPDETAFEAFHYEPTSYETLLEMPA